jgi:hypothetical protein
MLFRGSTLNTPAINAVYFMAVEDVHIDGKLILSKSLGAGVSQSV